MVEMGLFVMLCGVGVGVVIMALAARKGILNWSERQRLGARTGNEELAARVSEMEERLDFAERLLAQQREPGALPGKGDV